MSLTSNSSSHENNFSVSTHFQFVIVDKPLNVLVILHAMVFSSFGCTISLRPLPSVIILLHLDEKANIRIELKSGYLGLRSSVCFYICSVYSQAKYLVLILILNGNKLDQGSHHVRVLPVQLSFLFKF